MERASRRGRRNRIQEYGLYWRNLATRVQDSGLVRRLVQEICQRVAQGRRRRILHVGLEVGSPAEQPVQSAQRLRHDARLLLGRISCPSNQRRYLHYRRNAVRIKNELKPR